MTRPACRATSRALASAAPEAAAIGAAHAEPHGRPLGTYHDVVKQDATFDTSFWVNAYRAGLLPHVLGRFALNYAPDVAAELLEANPSGREFWRLVRAGAVRKVEPTTIVIREFGAGERAAMSVALGHRDWMLLLDDYRPYRASVERGMRVLCSPMLAVTLYDEGVIAEERLLAILDRLEAIRTVSPRLLEQARHRHRT